MSQNAGQCLGVHAAGEGMGGEGVAQVVGSEILGSPAPPEQRFHVEVGRAGVDRITPASPSRGISIG